MTSQETSVTCIVENTDLQLSVHTIMQSSSLIPQKLQGNFVTLSINVGNSELQILNLATHQLESTLQDILTAFRLCRWFIIIAPYVRVLWLQNFLLSVLCLLRRMLKNNYFMVDTKNYKSWIPLVKCKMFLSSNTWKISYFPKFRVLLTSLILAELHCMESQVISRKVI